MSAALSSLSRVAALSWNGHRQAVRDKVLHVLVVACAALIGGSIVISQLTIGERSRIVMDLGLSSISILASLTAVFVAVGQAAREIESRTADTILAKPVARWEFMVGRFGGLALTLGVMVLSMAVLHAGILRTLGAHDPQAWKAVLLCYVEALLVAAIALFFSSFATPLPALFISLSFVVIGHTSRGLALMAERAGDPAARWVLRLLHVALPNLELLNVRSEVVWGVEIPGWLVARACAYGLTYAGLLLVLGSAMLSRRDLA